MGRHPGRVHVSWLIDRYGVDPVYLMRWSVSGFLRRAGRTKRGGDQRADAGAPTRPGTWYEGWAKRMVPLLVMTRLGKYGGESAHRSRTQSDVLRDVAGALHDDPDAKWVVITDDGTVTTCATAAEVVARHAGHVCSTVVAVPEG